MLHCAVECKQGARADLNNGGCSHFCHFPITENATIADMKYFKFTVVVIVVVWLFFIAEGNSLLQLFDWSSGELVGSNIVILAILGLAIYVIRLAWNHTIGQKSIPTN
jgi:hypothetical protein